MFTSANTANGSNSELTSPTGTTPSERRAELSTDPDVLLRRSFARLHVQYVLSNDLALVCPLSQELQNAVTRAYGEYDDAYRFPLAISIDESLTNAIVHGNLEISSETRSDSLYEELMATRPSEKPYRDRHVFVDVILSREQIIIKVRDEGPGFDVAAVADPTARKNLNKVCGRGLMLMRHFMDAVIHNAKGNAVTMIKRAP